MPADPGAGPASGPDLAQTCAANIPVMRHVPKLARAAWAQCLTRALAGVAATNSLAAWTELLYAGRASRPIHPATSALAGRGANRPLEPPAARRRRLEQPGANQARCLKLAAEGELSRPCAALVAPPLLGAEDGVTAKLRAKHPQAVPARATMVPLGPPAQEAVPDIAATDVLQPSRASGAGARLALPACGVTISRKCWARRTPTRSWPTSRRCFNCSCGGKRCLSWPPTWLEPPYTRCLKLLMMSGPSPWVSASGALLLSASALLSRMLLVKCSRLSNLAWLCPMALRRPYTPHVSGATAMLAIAASASFA